MLGRGVNCLSGSWPHFFDYPPIRFRSIHRHDRVAASAQHKLGRAIETAAALRRQQHSERMPPTLRAAKALEPVRRQRCVTRRILNIAVPQAFQIGIVS